MPSFLIVYYGFISYDKEETPLAFQIETDVFKRNLYRARGNLHLLKEKCGETDRYSFIIYLTTCTFNP
jgi:hypothetical protein